MPSPQNGVLILDKDRAFGSRLAACLAGRGYHARQASTLFEGMNVLRRHPCGMIIADTALQAGDPEQLPPSYRKYRPLDPDLPAFALIPFYDDILKSHPAVLFTSPPGSPNLTRHMIDQQAEGFLQKPVPVETVADEVDAICAPLPPPAAQLVILSGLTNTGKSSLADSLEHMTRGYPRERGAAQNAMCTLPRLSSKRTAHDYASLDTVHVENFDRYLRKLKSAHKLSLMETVQGDVVTWSNYGNAYGYLITDRGKRRLSKRLDLPADMPYLMEKLEQEQTVFVTIGNADAAVKMSWCAQHHRIPHNWHYLAVDDIGELLHRLVLREQMPPEAEGILLSNSAHLLEGTHQEYWLYRAQGVMEAAGLREPLLIENGELTPLAQRLQTMFREHQRFERVYETLKHNIERVDASDFFAARKQVLQGIIEYRRSAHA